jgi:SpoVK/Ycf46/Vps4 family AAA+-type ATPase
MKDGSWLQTVVLKYRANVSNVIIACTNDHKRIHQFLEALGSPDFDLLLQTNYSSKIFFDLQRNKAYYITIKEDQENKTPQVTLGAEVAPSSPFGGLLETLDQELRSKATFLVISYAFLQKHAELLTDYLAAWSHDNELYRKFSKVIVFASSISLFTQNFLRLVYAFDVPLPNEEERRALLEYLVEKSRKKFGNLQLTQEVINATAGLNLHDIQTAFQESLLIYRNISIPVFADYKIRILRNYGMLYVEPTRGFESVGGYEYLKKYIRDRIINVIKNPERAQALGLRIPKGLLLYGPPGCGKTFLAKALAKELNLPMITLSPADLLRGIVGETEERTRQLGQLIESLAPIVVFIDEFDQLAIARGATFMGDSGVSRRMQSTLLEWLGDEKRKAFIVGATNFVTELDPAFIRPGRIDEIVLMLYPDPQARKEILKVQTSIIKKVPVGNVNFDELAEKTFLFSGAELEKLVMEAASNAFIRNSGTVEQEDFINALKIFEINTNERIGRVYQMISEIRKLESVNQAFLQESLKALAEAERDERLRGVLERL